MHSFYKLLGTACLCLGLLSTLKADDQSTEARLRDALKSAVQQLRAAQDQLATAQAAQADSDQKLAASQAELTQTKADLSDLKQKSEADHASAVQAIGQLQEQNAFLQRLVEDRERKNYELFKTGNEVLTKYEKFGLGEALEAKEPFIGLTKVKLENQVQGYQDKFAQNKTYAGQPISPMPKDQATDTKAEEAKAAEVKPPLPTKQPSSAVSQLSPASATSSKAAPSTAPTSVAPVAQVAPETPAPLSNPHASPKPTTTTPDKDKVIQHP